MQVDGKTCAWVTSQYVFSPIDLPAAGTASGGVTLPGAGNNAVTGVLHISMLLDLASHHIAWLHRSQPIDNKLTLASSYDESDPAEVDDPQYDPQDDDWPNPTLDLSNRRSNNPGRHPFLTFHFQEEARARLLPDERSVEWLAALKNFESTPEPSSGTVPMPATKTLLPNPIILAAKPAVVKRSTPMVVDSDSLVPTPAGFTRYEKACAETCGSVRPCPLPCPWRCRSRMTRHCAPSTLRCRGACCSALRSAQRSTGIPRD